MRIGCFIAHDARGLDQQHNDQDCEHHAILPDGQSRGGDHDLRDADDKTAHHGAGDRADTPQHGGDKGLQPQHGAHGRVCHAVVSVEIQHGGHARQGGAHGEGEGDRPVQGNAHQLGGPHVLGHGPHGLAQLGLLYQKGQAHHADDRHHDGEHGGVADGHRPDRDGAAHGQTNRLGARAEEQLEPVFQQEGDADGGDEQGQAGRGAQGRIGHLLNGHAQQRAGRHRQDDRQDRVEMEAGHGAPHHVSAHHDNVAVGEVEQADNAIDHAVAQRHQGEDAAQLQAVDQLVEDQDHGVHAQSHPFFFRRQVPK